MKRLKIGIVVSVLFIMGCQTTNSNIGQWRQLNKYPIYEISIEDIPPLQDVVAIGFLDSPDYPDLNDIYLLVGDKELVEDIIERPISPSEIRTNYVYIKSFMAHLNNYLRINNVTIYSDTYFILFTRYGGFLKKIETDDYRREVRGVDFKSSDLYWELYEFKLVDPKRDIDKEINDYFNSAPMFPEINQ